MYFLTVLAVRAAVARWANAATSAASSAISAERVASAADSGGAESSVGVRPDTEGVAGAVVVDVLVLDVVTLGSLSRARSVACDDHKQK